MIVRGISYAGCGFKGTYHFGATAALKNHLGSSHLGTPYPIKKKVSVAVQPGDLSHYDFSKTGYRPTPFWSTIS